MGNKYQDLLDEAIDERGSKCRDAEDKSPWWVDPPKNTPARYAEEVCSGCPVIEECKAWARNSANFIGIAGGYYWRSSHSERWLTLEGLPSDEPFD